jgi:DNA modification methylase
VLEMVNVKLIQGHILEAIKQIPDNSIDCIITSPPYWGLRRYPDSANVIWDGDSNCEHEWGNETTQLAHEYRQGKGSKAVKEHDEILMGFHKHKAPFCKKCGAWKGQLGLEPNLELYLKHLLQITAELKRVLKPTGVMFWNHGDCYGGSGCGSHEHRDETSTGILRIDREIYQNKPVPQLKLTPKCMALQNYRLILSILDDLRKWELRDDLTEEEKEYVIKELIKFGVLK